MCYGKATVGGMAWGCKVVSVHSGCGGFWWFGMWCPEWKKRCPQPWWLLVLIVVVGCMVVMCGLIGVAFRLGDCVPSRFR